MGRAGTRGVTVVKHVARQNRHVPAILGPLGRHFGGLLGRTIDELTRPGTSSETSACA